MKRPPRWLMWAAGVPAALSLIGLGGYQLALHRLQAGILQALGPHASVGAMDLGWRAVELHDLRVRASGAGWPAEDELRAARVQAVPDVRSALRGQWRVQRVTIEGAYISVLRTRPGQLRLLPAWLERVEGDKAGLSTVAHSRPPALAPVSASMPDIHIQQVLLKDVQVAFFDASIQRKPYQLLLEHVNADLGPLALPALAQPVRIDLGAQLRGPHRNGRITLQGELTPATRDAQIATRLEGVDLIALQPYLLKLNEGGVRRGTLDMQLDARVRDNRLHAPGRMTLIDLELGNGQGLLGSIAGVPRRAVLAAMSQHGRIELSFTLDGQLDDPAFSLNEQLAMRTAAGLAEALGVSLSGIAEGVGSVIKGLFGR